jgi:predicted dinucleotide-binding enzyme
VRTPARSRPLRTGSASTVPTCCSAQQTSTGPRAPGHRSDRTRQRRPPGACGTPGWRPGRYTGGETLRLSSADHESARTLAAQIGRVAVVAAGNRDALQGAGAVVLALRFTVLKGVMDEIAGPLTGKLVVVPSNPLTTDAHGNVVRVLPEGQSSGKVAAGWLPAGARLAMAFGTLSADLFESAADRSPEPAVLFYVTDDDRAGEEAERLIRTAGFEPVKAGRLGQSGRLEVGGDLHDLVVGPA